MAALNPIPMLRQTLVSSYLSFSILIISGYFWKSIDYFIPKNQCLTKKFWSSPKHGWKNCLVLPLIVFFPVRSRKWTIKWNFHQENFNNFKILISLLWNFKWSNYFISCDTSPEIMVKTASSVEKMPTQLLRVNVEKFKYWNSWIFNIA